MMGYCYLDHTADMGVRATGPTISAAFCEAAAGMFALMVDPGAIRPEHRFHVELSAVSVENLLVDWLSILLAQKDLSGLVFSRFDVGIRRQGGQCELLGTAMGETIDRDRHGTGTEVKGVSYLGLSVVEGKDCCTAQFVLDV